MMRRRSGGLLLAAVLIGGSGIAWAPWSASQKVESTREARGMQVSPRGDAAEGPAQGLSMKVMERGAGVPSARAQGASQVVEPVDPAMAKQEALRRYAATYDAARLAAAIRSCDTQSMPGAATGGGSAPGTESLPPVVMTVMREGRDLSLRELGQPVALRLDGEQYPERRLRLHVNAGEGLCRLVVDRGTVQVDGVLVPQGSACPISSGAEVVWTGEAGIRLEDPRRTDTPGGAG